MRGFATIWRDLTARHPLTEPVDVGAARPGQHPALPPLGRQAGLTMVELLVDVSLVATLALSAIMMTSHYLESGRARSAAEQVMGAMQQARQYAIANAATYTVTLTGSTVAVTCTAGCPPPPNPGEPATPIANGATTNVPAPPIEFRPLGDATAATVTVTYPGATQWQVRVSAAGRVRACTPTCS